MHAHVHVDLMNMIILTLLLPYPSLLHMQVGWVVGQAYVIIETTRLNVIGIILYAVGAEGGLGDMQMLTPRLSI